MRNRFILFRNVRPENDNYITVKAKIVAKSATLENLDKWRRQRLFEWRGW